MEWCFKLGKKTEYKRGYYFEFQGRMLGREHIMNHKLNYIEFLGDVVTLGIHWIDCELDKMIVLLLITQL